MNIDWNDAPYWANWAAMDNDGTWWWFEFKPTFYELEEEWYSAGKCEKVTQSMDTLVQRPIKD